MTIATQECDERFKKRQLVETGEARLCPFATRFSWVNAQSRESSTSSSPCLPAGLGEVVVIDGFGREQTSIRRPRPSLEEEGYLVTFKHLLNEQLKDVHHGHSCSSVVTAGAGIRESE